MRFGWLPILAACGAREPSREQRVIDALSEDNFVAMAREPELVSLKLKKMQRGPYEWLRGTASIYWRDLMEPGGERPVTAFGSPESSRVLLVGDPHVENVGTFRAADGTMFVDWNDFDATGYGPFTGDVRRLASAFVVVARLGAPADDVFADELAQLVARGYADQIKLLSTGARIAAVSLGEDALFDKQLRKAKTRGDARAAVDELAPIAGGARALALGDLEDVAPDGVIEDRVLAVDSEQARAIDEAIAQWAPGHLDAGQARIKLRARRIGSGVSSYASFRFQVVLEGPTPAPDDDLIVELKETREGVIVHGVPVLEGGEWGNPAVRAVDTQRRLQARRDGDRLLGAAQTGGLALKVRDREAYQRGIDATDLEALASESEGDRDELRNLARIYGALLARAHGEAMTSDRQRGVDVIAPLLVGREDAFAQEISTFAMADAWQIFEDHAAMKDRDLAAAIASPGGS